MAVLATGLETGVFFDHCAMSNPRLLFLANGVNRIQMNDGYTNWEAGIDEPAAVATYSAQVNGSLSTGEYMFDYCYRRSKHGIVGNGVGASAVMNAAADPNDGIRITIAANAALQSGIDQVEVYRTLVAGGAFFYDGRKAYSGSSITYDATAADTALGAAISSDYGTPLARPFIEAFGEQIHLWGSRTHNDGTMAVTNGSATITGTNANLTKGMAGMRFNRTGDGSKFYTITAVDVSGQTATISPVYEGTTGATAVYTISLNSLRSEWSLIDTSGNILPESFPTDNYEDFQGGGDNEEAAGIGKTNNQVVLFTNRSTYTQTKVGANTYRKDLLLPGVGCGNFRTIANEPKSGNLFWQNQQGQVMRTSGMAGSNFNVSEHFIANILDGTHEGIHRNLRVNTDKYAAGHAIYYGFKNWYMLFQCLEGQTYPNACFVFNAKINPYGAKDLPSPWVMWTGFTAVCSGLLLDTKGILRPYFGDELGFYWLMDTGTNDGVPSGTASGEVTGASATTLEDSAATFYTTGDGLKGVQVKVTDSNGDTVDTQTIQSNTADEITVTSWNTEPSVGDTYSIGGIGFERYTKVFDDDAPEKVKKAHNLYITGKKASSSRGLNVHIYEDFSTTPKVALGQEVDMSEKSSHQIRLFARGHHQQLKFTSDETDKPIEIYNFQREVITKGKR